MAIITNSGAVSDGATLVDFDEIIHGTKAPDSFIWQTAENTPANLANFRFELDYVFTKMTLNPSIDRNGNLDYAVSNWSAVTTDAEFMDATGTAGTGVALPGADVSNIVETVNAATGSFRINWPTYVYPENAAVPINTNTDVPVIYATLFIKEFPDGTSSSDMDNDANATIIDAVRLLRVIRHGNSVA